MPLDDALDPTSTTSRAPRSHSSPPLPELWTERPPPAVAWRSVICLKKQFNSYNML